MYLKLTGKRQEESRVCHADARQRLLRDMRMNLITIQYKKKVTQTPNHLIVHIFLKKMLPCDTIMKYD